MSLCLSLTCTVSRLFFLFLGHSLSLYLHLSLNMCVFSYLSVPASLILLSVPQSKPAYLSALSLSLYVSGFSLYVPLCLPDSLSKDSLSQGKPGRLHERWG